MYQKIIVVVLAALVTPSVFSAEGAYNVVGLGLSPLVEQSNTTLDFGVSIGGGYSFNKYFGVEAQIGLLGIGSGNDVSSMPIPSVALIGYIPLREDSTLYGKFGKSATTVDSNYSGTTNFYGVGVEFSSLSSPKNTYRLGIDHYDLSLAPGAPLSTNYLNLTSTTYF